MLATMAGSFRETRLRAAIDFASHGNAVATDIDFGRERALTVAAQCREHLARLVVVAVDGLFAKDNQLRLFLVEFQVR